MILGFDIGNTHICPIIFSDEGEILEKFRIPSKSIYTEDIIFSNLKVLCEYKNIDLNKISDIVISSVVPHLDEIFVYFSKKFFNKKAYFVNMQTLPQNTLIINSNGEKNLGADRICTVLAMQKRIKDKSCIIIDFGTATTFEVIKNNKYLGGAILPGIELSINALFQNTAKLPKVEFNKPESVLSNTTVSQINTGIYYGNVGAIKELILQYKSIEKDAYVVTTGGHGYKISNELGNLVDKYMPNLCEEGMFEFYKLVK